eukprot:scaffold14992_cov69-Phaeocystis_antarctica.AAC.6
MSIAVADTETPHSGLRRGAGRGVFKTEVLERRQRAAVERSGQGGAAGVGDLGAVEAEQPELRQYSRPATRASPPSRRRTCRLHEGGKALVADRVTIKIETLQRG